MWMRRDEPGAQMLPGTGRVVLEEGVNLVREAFGVVQECRERIVACAQSGPDEWWHATGVDPGNLARFLEYRIDNLRVLAREGHWLGMAAAVEGGHVLDFGL